MNYKPGTILVTGAAGFIGSHTAEALLKRGDIVIGIDNLNDYYDPARKLANIEEARASIPDKDRFIFIKGDIRDKDLIKRLFKEHRIDVVIHLAAMAGVRASIENPLLYYDVNLIGTMNLLDFARDNNVTNFVFASTSSVYGSTKQIPFQETDNCDRPLAPYPASKRAVEILGYTYHHLYKMNFTALRFFTVYGPRGRPDMMAYKLLDNIFFGKEVPLFNEGQMHRDWTFINDIVTGVVAAADRPLGYEIINLGRGQPVLLADFVKYIEEVAGRKAHLIPAPMNEADVPYTYADVSKARKLLGYEPKVSVKEGVVHFWNWYKKAVLKENHSR